MRMVIFRTVALTALVLAPCWGCGPPEGTLAPLISVKGKVTYKGQPLTKGTVLFEPADGYGRPATGKLQSDGTFELTTLKEGDGVVAGHHRVSIVEVEKSLSKNPSFQKYASPNTSKLTADVSAEKTEFTFDIP
ncbi:MAG: hypothetical protein ACHRXM_10365 [Isosphaerales bacterium]